MPLGLYTGPDVSIANGVTTVFPYTFRILASADLLVMVDGVEQVAGYTVDGVGNASGGNVTFSVAPANGAEVLRARDASYDRATDYQRNGSFDEETVDKDFDRIVMLIQQLRESAGRSPALPIGSPLSGLFDLPDPVADGYWKWNAAGTAVEFVALSGLSSVPVSAFMGTVLDDATPAAARATLGASAVGDAVFIAASAAAARTALGAIGATENVSSGFTLVNGYLDWNVGGSALTVAVKTLAGADPSAADPVYAAFRNGTPSSGLPVIRTISAATSIVINNTATLGTANNIPFRLWAVLFDDAGTVRVGVINCFSGNNIFPLQGWGIASSTLEDNASDFTHVFYTDGASVGSKPYAVVGWASWETGLAAAGVWSAEPTRKQLFGIGQRLPNDRVQFQRGVTLNGFQTTTVLPADNTTPQSGEGAEAGTVTITPSSAANSLRIKAAAFGARDAGAGVAVGALYQDATANALRARQTAIGAGGFGWSMELAHVMLAAVSVATTFKHRYGPGTAGTLFINRDSASADLFNSLCDTYIEVEEVMA